MIEHNVEEKVKAVIRHEEHAKYDHALAQMPVLDPEAIAQIVALLGQRVVQLECQIILHAQHDSVRYSAQYEVEAHAHNGQAVGHLIHAEFRVVSCIAANGHVA